MNRKYTKEDIKRIVELLRKNFKETILTADIIVGFPGETEKEFKETYETLKEIKLYKIHVFPYSKREGTKAAMMEEQISSEIKMERSKKVIALSDNLKKEYNETYIGKKLKILIEEKEGKYYKGHADNYIYVNIISDKENLQNEIIEVMIKEIQEDIVVGEIV